MSDYSHRFHAGNHGDVFKHAALLLLLEAVTTAAGKAPLTYIETHSGEGRYTLGSTGEWTEGIGRLDAAPGAGDHPGASGFQRALIRAGARRVPNRGGDYLGSPLLALGALRPTDRVVLFERNPEAATALRRAVAADKRAQVEVGDGLAGLTSLLARLKPDDRPCVHLDPAYTEKEEWAAIAQSVAALHRTRPNAVSMLWYPIKSLTRPNTLHNDLRRLGVAAAAVELHVTPQEIKRNALHGSGLVLCNAPPALVPAVGALAAWLGPFLATHDGRYFVRTLGWAAPGGGWAAPGGGWAAPART